jgi:hypothetical protein
MVFSRIIIGFIVSKEGEIMDPKKVKSLVNMLPPLPTYPSFLWNGTILQVFYQKLCLYYVTNHRTTQEV